MTALSVRDYFNPTAGIVVLSAITAFVSIWMYSQRGLSSPATPHETPTFTKAELSRFNADLAYLPNDPLLGFVAIPAGSFVMGSDPASDRMAYENERWSAAQPQGAVMLPEFYIGRYEVTVAQFHAFAAATGYAVYRGALQASGDLPITDIAWTDALAYARWLQTTLQQSNNTPAPIKEKLSRGWVVTLPTEAQWEKAARGADARIFPWGDMPSRNHANFGSTSVKPVGSFECPTCAYGLSDMSGNVWEFTLSPLRSYPYSNDAPNPHSDALYVMRGGAYNDSENNIRTAVRGGIDPGARRNFIGFRLALSPPQSL